MMNLKRTGSGPDGFPYWFWKDFAPYLAPVLTPIINSSLKQQSVPILWKLANFTPIPKELPFSECDQLRPISLTNIITRIFEKLVFKQEISAKLKSIIRKDQFAYRTESDTTMAIIECQHQWLKWLEEFHVKSSDFWQNVTQHFRFWSFYIISRHRYEMNACKV